MDSKIMDIKRQIEDIVLDIIIAWNDKQGTNFNIIDIRWDLKGSCAGQFCIRADEMYFRFNLDIAQDNVKETLEETVPHEVAHYLTRMKYGQVKPHGREWQMVMYHLGKEPTVTHKMNFTPARQTKPQNKYNYTCPACGHKSTFTKTLFIRIINYQTYRCKCGQAVNSTIMILENFVQ